MPVLSVADAETVDDAGQLQNVYEIVYEIPGRAGSFTFTVPRSQDPVEAALAEIRRLTSQVNSIYSLD